MRVLVDMDGVLCDILHPWLSWYHSMSNHWDTELDLHDVRDYDISKYVRYKETFRAVLHQEGFFDSLPPLPYAAGGLKEVADVSDTYILTTPPWTGGEAPQRAYWEKQCWLERELGFDPTRIIGTSRKEIVSGDVLVEDRPDNIDNWLGSNPTGLAILVEWGYNADMPCRAQHRVDWEEAWSIIPGLITRRRELLSDMSSSIQTLRSRGT